MKMTTREKLENGCGFQDNSWKSSLCIKGNLCSECRNGLDYFNQGREEGVDEFNERIKRFLGDIIDSGLDEDIVYANLDKIVKEIKKNEKNNEKTI